MNQQTSRRWQSRPPGANWGDFGPDDQIGRLNLITPKKVMDGIREIKEGRSFCLSLPLDFPGGNVLNERRHAPKLTPTVINGCACFNFPASKNYTNATDVICDDQVTLSLQYSTQWDALAHIGALFDADGDGVPEMVYYNGFRANEQIVGPTNDDDAASSDAPGDRCYGAHALDIATLAVKAIQGRAVLIDLKHHYGEERRLIGYQEIRRVIESDRLSIGEGDIVAIRTGFAETLLGMNRNPDLEVLNAYGCVLDGRDDELLQWISASGIVAICADNYAVEGISPARTPGPHSVVPLHEHCLFKLGIPLGELWWFGELAPYLRSADRYAFFLTAPPLRLPGAVGSPVTPVATV
jgi:kynurenine formamidase